MIIDNDYLKQDIRQRAYKNIYFIIAVVYPYKIAFKQHMLFYL